MFGVPGTMQPGYTGTITNFQIVLNTQLNTCQNFPAQKNPQIKHRRTPPPHPLGCQNHNRALLG